MTDFYHLDVIGSTAISSISYDDSESILRVDFHPGYAYAYFDVPFYVYQEFEYEPESFGTYFNQNVRNNYSCQLI